MLMQTLAVVIATLFPLLAVLFVAQVWLSWRFLKKLKIEHQSAWESLGKPSMFLGASISNQKSVRSFISTKGYLELNDKEINKICSFTEKLNAIYLPVFLLLAFCFLLLVFLKNSTS